MQILRERILAEGVNLGNGILKIDSILNHQIHPGLMREIGEELAAYFVDIPIDRILTAEISGIAPAIMVSLVLDVPVIYARKKKPITMAGPVFLETAPSYTKGGDVHLLVSAEFLHAGENVLIIDDFLSSSKTLMALARIIASARANLVGIGVVVEKAFEGGREAIANAGYDCPIHSLVTVLSMDGDQIVLAE